MAARKTALSIPSAFASVLMVMVMLTCTTDVRGASFQGLGDLPGGEFSSFPWAVSADGSVVVGDGFIWDSTNGMQNLRDVLVGLGLDLTGWTLRESYISGDGLTIAGSGTNPSGQREAWIAVIPEPSTSLLLGLGVAGLAVLRRRSAPT